MKKKDWMKEVQAEVAMRLGNGYDVQIKEIRKNNGVVLTGLLIYDRTRNVTPTVYLEAFYEAYKQGKEMEEIVDGVLKLYSEHLPVEEVNMDFFLNFEAVKDRIVYKLIHAERNADLLKEIPHICFLDLAICFCYDFNNEQMGDGMILIRNEQVSCWDTCTKELMQLAHENTKVLFGLELLDLMELVREPEDQLANTFVLSNEKRCFGAAAMIYPGVLAEVAEKVEGNLLILPSSVHEVILMKESGTENLQELLCMVKEINREWVLEEEILSDQVYYYSREKGNLGLAGEREEERLS